MLWEAIKLANQSVRRNALRSVLTLLGIVIGVGAVIAMVTIGNGTTQKVTVTSPNSAATCLSRARGGTRSAPEAGRRCAQFTERNVAALRTSWQRCEGSRHPLRGRHGPLWGGELRHKGEGHRIGILCRAGLDFSKRAAFLGWRRPVGQFVCVIGQTVKAVLFGQVDPLGLHLRLGGLSCEVIGVLNGKGQSAFWLPGQHGCHAAPHLSAAHRGEPAGGHHLHCGGVHQFHPHRPGGGDDILREQRRVDGREENDFSVRDMTQMVSALTSTTMAMTALLGAIAA